MLPIGAKLIVPQQFKIPLIQKRNRIRNLILVGGTSLKSSPEILKESFYILDDVLNSLL